MIIVQDSHPSFELTFKLRAVLKTGLIISSSSISTPPSHLPPTISFLIFFQCCFQLQNSFHTRCSFYPKLYLYGPTQDRATCLYHFTPNYKINTFIKQQKGVIGIPTVHNGGFCLMDILNATNFWGGTYFPGKIKHKISNSTFIHNMSNHLRNNNKNLLNWTELNKCSAFLNFWKPF